MVREINSITEMISRMTLREKIGQTFQRLLSDVPADNSDELAEYLHKYPLGSLFAGQEIIKAGGAPGEALRERVTACQKATGIPLSLAGDLENGVGGAVAGFSQFPNLMSLGAAGNEQLAYEYGMWTAKDAVSIGFNWLFAPVADLSFNWLNPIVGTRALGEDPKKVISLLRQLIRGYQDYGLSATAKHFPGDGVDFRNQHLTTTINSLNKEQWLQTFGKVYKECFDLGVHSIMAGHIALPWVDSELSNGRPKPATVSYNILTKLAREELGFTGVIVSDALIMAGFVSWNVYEKRLVEAFNAGIDVMLWPGLEYFEIMEQAVAEGRVTEARLDESVRRILEMKCKQGLIEEKKAGRVVEKNIEKRTYITSSAAELAETIAQKSITLVRNRKNLLPLDFAKINKVLFLLATAKPEHSKKKMKIFFATLAERNIEYEIIINGNCLDIDKLEKAGKRFDALLCFFDHNTPQIKNSSRPVGELAEQIWTLQYTRTMEPVVISIGIPVILNDIPFAHTLVNTYSSSPADLQALGKALFGKAEFEGVSPVDTGGDWVHPAMTYMVDKKLESLNI